MLVLLVREDTRDTEKCTTTSTLSIGVAVTVPGVGIESLSSVLGRCRPFVLPLRLAGEVRLNIGLGDTAGNLVCSQQ